MQAAGTLYRRFCMRCHGADGKGMRGEGVPDFTQAAWHRRRSDAQFAAVILEGKSVAMPAFGGRLSKTQARALAAHLRSFAPLRDGNSGMSTDEIDTRFRQLQRELEELRRLFQELTAAESALKKERAPARRGGLAFET
jgi:hypothetical protein